jgi:hypothetical protein
MLRWDSAFDYTHPDRNEWMFARNSTNPNQVGPGNKTNIPGKGFASVPSKVDYEELSYYTEIAASAAGAFFELPYREVDPEAANIPGFANNQIGPFSNFADLKAGAKTLLLDCELIQFGFQFKVYIPSGSSGKGLGTGHTSLEPSFLFNVKISDLTYLQGQTAYWIPIAADPIYSSEVFHSHLSINHILWEPCHNFKLIGTAELQEWTILGGSFTSTDFLLAGKPVAISAKTTIVNVGPGIRGVICDRIDLGVGSSFSVTGDRWAEELIRAELRLHF